MMKLIKASRELDVKEEHFLLISKLGNKYIYGNTYWLMSNKKLLNDGTITVKGIEGVKLALEPLRAELAQIGSYETFDNFLGTDVMTEVNEENINDFHQYYNASSDPVMLEFLSTITSLDGYNVGQLLVLSGMDILLKVGKELEQIGEDDE